eukprot:scaffold5.g677.t1
MHDFEGLSRSCRGPPAVARQLEAELQAGKNNALRFAGAAEPLAALSATTGQGPEHAPGQEQQERATSVDVAAAQEPQAVAHASGQRALSLLRQGGTVADQGEALAAPFLQSLDVQRTSLKVYGCRPELVMAAARSDLGALVCSMACGVEACVRPGCTSLTIDALLAEGQPEEQPEQPPETEPERQRQEGPHPAGVGEAARALTLGSELQPALEALLASGGPLGTLLSSRRAVLQAGDQVAVVAEGQVTLSTGDAVPTIRRVWPPCIHVPPPRERVPAAAGAAASVGRGGSSPAVEEEGEDEDCGTEEGDCGTEEGDCRSEEGDCGTDDPAAAPPQRLVAVHGTQLQLGSPDGALLCRQHGRHLAVELHAWGSSSEQQEWGSVYPVGLEQGNCAAADEVCRLVAATLAAGAGTTTAAPPAAAAGAARAADAVPADVEPTAEAAAAVVDVFLREVGLVARFVHAGALEAGGTGDGPPFTPTLRRQVASLAAKLVAVAASRGCPALTALLLHGARADGRSAAAAAAAMEAACVPGVPLLAAAVASRAPAVVDALRTWGAAHGHAWQLEAGPEQAAWQASGGRLLPPVLAALREDGGAMAAALAACIGLDAASLSDLLSSPQGGGPASAPPADGDQPAASASAAGTAGAPYPGAPAWRPAGPAGQGVQDGKDSAGGRRGSAA